MLRNRCYWILLILVGNLPAAWTVSRSFNSSLCAFDASRAYFNSPNSTFLYDQTGRPTANFADAWGISYRSCRALCGTRDNTEAWDWDFLSQDISSWLLPWLALSAQLPFETKDKTTDFAALLLTIGSPALAAYSLACTLLNARGVNQTFRQLSEESYCLHRPLQTKAIRAARSVLIEMQHVSIQVYNGRHREISQLIVRPENWAWWCSLRQKLLISKRRWTYSLYAQVGFVCVSQLLAILNFFIAKSSRSSIGIGLAINSLWLWMIPIVLGWVYVGTQSSAASIRIALKGTNPPTLGSERHFEGDCSGIRDRTTYTYSSVMLQSSTDSHHPPHDKIGQQRGDSRHSGSAPNLADVLDPEKEYTNRTSCQVAFIRQELPTSDNRDILSVKGSDSIELQSLVTDRRGGTSLLPHAFMGFSIVGDELAPGPIFNYARVWTHTNATKWIAEAFLTFISRQKQRETVDGHEWEKDPDRWNENLKGTPKQMSQYISPLYEDLQYIPVHAPASADLVWNCVTAAFVAVCLQWGTTGAAIVIAYQTPTIGLGCESGSYLIYGLASTIAWLALTFSAYLSHLYSLRLENSNGRGGPCTLLASLAVLTRVLGKLLASANAIFVIATSVLQFSGLLDNCWCNACIPSLGETAGWVVLFASDAQIFAASKSAWIGGVFMGIIVGGAVSLWIFIARGDELFDGDEL